MHRDEEQLITDARWEWSRDGTIKTNTFMALQNAGIDANILMAQFEADKDNAYPEGYGTGDK